MRAAAAVAVVVLVGVAGCSASEPDTRTVTLTTRPSEIETLGRELCDMLGSDSPTASEYDDIVWRASYVVGAQDDAYGVGETLIAIYCPQFG